MRVDNLFDDDIFTTSQFKPVRRTETTSHEKNEKNGPLFFGHPPSPPLRGDGGQKM